MIAIHTKNNSGIPFERAILEKMKKTKLSCLNVQMKAVTDEIL